MKEATQSVRGSAADSQHRSRPAGPSADQSWMVWLRPDAHEDPGPERAGLDRAHAVHALGRCLFILPNHEVAHSWCCRDGRAALLCGHLLNREELRKQLELPATPSPTEAELLLAAYGTWGADAAARLEGPYAAFVWDEAEDRLLCIRDAVGVMPLFYARVGAGLVLSADIWTVLGHPGVSREIDRVLLAAFMLSRYSRVEETFFTQVRRLPGGHFLQLRGADVTITRYWNPLPVGRPIDWMEPVEVERFPELMLESVASYLALGPAAISLSSGIDSVSVAAFATEAAEKHGWPRPHALSVHFEHPGCDESAGQTAVANALRMPFHLLCFSDCLGDRPLLEATMELAPRYPSPLINMWEPLYCHLAGVARSRGLSLILTGTGGDEWLGVTPLLAADLIRAADFLGLWRLYRTQLRSYPVSPIPFGRNILWRFGLQLVLSDLANQRFPNWMARRRQRLHQPMALPDWISRDPELRRSLLDRLEPPPPAAPVDSIYIRELRPALEHALVAMELEEFHYRGRGRGVSYFHPYWSRRVIEFLLRTPPSMLNQGGRSKGIVRSLLAERLPELDFQQQKKYTVVQFYQGIVEQQQPMLWARWASTCALARADVIDKPRFEEALQAAATERAGRAGHAAMWLSTEAWLRGQL